jgi:glucose-1-phosphate adenylyltransferase
MMGRCGWRYAALAVRRLALVSRGWARWQGAKMAGKRVLGIVLAGGAGKGLAPLTAERAKAAVPFDGVYRVVDFALSNLVNGGIRRICVLTQYKSHSLDRHLAMAWRLSSLLGDYVTPVPAQQWLGPHWQTGSADAIHQSLSVIYTERPDLVAVCGADHVYRMDPAQMIDQHTAWGAGVTVAATAVPRTQAAGLGVVQTVPSGHRIEAFWEKPADPPGRPGHPGEAFVSMGIYVFDADVLVEALTKDAADNGSRHSIGGDIIPMLVRERAAHVYDFGQNEVPGAGGRDGGYWRDLATLDAYFDAHMDLCAVHPVFNLYNDRWPILTLVSAQPPAKFVHDNGDRVGRAINSVVSNGVIISGGLVRDSVLSPGARADSWSRVDRAVILNNSRVSRRAVVEHAILDKDVTVLEGATVGVDKEHDRARGLTVSRGGVTVVSKGQVVAP